MIEIKITGQPLIITRKETRALLKWMARELCIDNYKKPLLVNLSFKRNLKKRTGYRGTAIWEDTNYRPREFSIEVDDSLSRLVTTRVLIHEMTHVKQYAKGELRDLLRSFSLKRWSTKWGRNLIDERVLGYRKLPWEIEAFGNEKIYFKKWREYNNKNHR